MAKMVVETMDTGLLRSLVAADFDAKSKSSLKLLEGVLSVWNSPEEVSAVKTPFFNLYYLRSAGSAHLRGSTWEKTLEQTGLAGLNVRELVRQAMQQSVVELQAMQQSVVELQALQKIYMKVTRFRGHSPAGAKGCPLYAAETP